jgi:hypothetical protein
MLEEGGARILVLQVAVVEVVVVEVVVARWRSF